MKPYIVYIDAVSTCSSLINTPEDGSLFAKIYVGVENYILYLLIILCNVGFDLNWNPFSKLNACLTARTYENQ
jgi:hypothetical protein